MHEVDGVGGPSPSPSPESCEGVFFCVLRESVCNILQRGMRRHEHNTTRSATCMVPSTAALHVVVQEP